MITVAVDECVKETHDCDSTLGVCTDTSGGFNCTCIDGFRGDGRTCENINECGEQIDDCPENAGCTDTDGSFTCTCNPGFSGDGKTCAGTMS